MELEPYMGLELLLQTLLLTDNRLIESTTTQGHNYRTTHSLIESISTFRLSRKTFQGEQTLKKENWKNFSYSLQTDLIRFLSYFRNLHISPMKIRHKYVELGITELKINNKQGLYN